MGDDARVHHPPHDAAPEIDIAALRAVQATPQFIALRRRHRLFVLPVTAVCLLWYFAYVLGAGYAPQVFSIPVWGSMNLGIVLGLAQVATTFIVTTIYVWYANKHLDPAAAAIRAELEPQHVASPAAVVPA